MSSKHLNANSDDINEYFSTFTEYNINVLENEADILKQLSRKGSSSSEDNIISSEDVNNVASCSVPNKSANHLKQLCRRGNSSRDKRINSKKAGKIFSSCSGPRKTPAKHLNLKHKKRKTQKVITDYFNIVKRKLPAEDSHNILNIILELSQNEQCNKKVVFISPKKNEPNTNKELADILNSLCAHTKNDENVESIISPNQSSLTVNPENKYREKNICPSIKDCFDDYYYRKYHLEDFMTWDNVFENNLSRNLVQNNSPNRRDLNFTKMGNSSTNRYHPNVTLECSTGNDLNKVLDSLKSIEDNEAVSSPITDAEKFVLDLLNSDKKQTIGSLIKKNIQTKVANKTTKLNSGNDLSDFGDKINLEKNTQSSTELFLDGLKQKTVNSNTVDSQQNYKGNIKTNSSVSTNLSKDLFEFTPRNINTQNEKIDCDELEISFSNENAIMVSDSDEDLLQSFIDSCQPNISSYNQKQEVKKSLNPENKYREKNICPSIKDCFDDYYYRKYHLEDFMTWDNVFENNLSRNLVQNNSPNRRDLNFTKMGNSSNNSYHPNVTLECSTGNDLNKVLDSLKSIEDNEAVSSPITDAEKFVLDLLNSDKKQTIGSLIKNNIQTKVTNKTTKLSSGNDLSAFGYKINSEKNTQGSTELFLDGLKQKTVNSNTVDSQQNNKENIQTNSSVSTNLSKDLFDFTPRNINTQNEKIGCDELEINFSNENAIMVSDSDEDLLQSFIDSCQPNISSYNQKQEVKKSLKPKTVSNTEHDLPETKVSDGTPTKYLLINEQNPMSVNFRNAEEIETELSNLTNGQNTVQDHLSSELNRTERDSIPSSWSQNKQSSSEKYLNLIERNYAFKSLLNENFKSGCGSKNKNLTKSAGSFQDDNQNSEKCTFLSPVITNKHSNESTSSFYDSQQINSDERNKLSKELFKQVIDSLYQNEILEEAIEKENSEDIFNYLMKQPTTCKMRVKKYRKGKLKIYRLKPSKKKVAPTKRPSKTILNELSQQLNINLEPIAQQPEKSFNLPSLSSSYDTVTSETFSTGSFELTEPQQKLREGVNNFLKDKTLLCNENLVVNLEEQKEEIKIKIRRIILKILEDFRTNRKMSFELRKQTQDNCVFKDGRLQLKPSGEVKLTKVNFHYSQSQMKFSLMFYILSKVKTLLETNTKLTKREIYYQLKNFTNSQYATNEAINAVSCLLEVGPWALNIIAQKGLVYGNLNIIFKSGETLNCNIPGVAIPQDINEILEIRSAAYFILVVEKEAIFSKLIEEGLPNRLTRPFIMITGKGFPDLNTQLFVKKLWTIMSLPVFILTDADPDGIRIMLNYKYGSAQNAHLSEFLAIPAAKWLGVFPSEILRLNIARQSLTNREMSVIDSLLKSPYMMGNSRFSDELNVLMEKQYKAGIEGLMKTDTFLSEVYLPNKFYSNDYI